MSEVTIAEVHGPEEITFGDGTAMNKYELTLNNGTTAEAWRPLISKDGKPIYPPKVGDTGTVDGKKFKKPPKGGGWGGGGGGSKMSPERERSIIRQHSQEMALRCAALQIGGKPVLTFGELKKLIDWFEHDATNTPVAEHPTPESINQPPAQAQEFTPPSAPDDDEIPF
jgi:hypothetical protein